MTLTSNSIDLVFATHKALSNAFLLALKTYRYNAAIHLFCHANGFSMPDSFDCYPNKTKCHSINVLGSLLDEIIITKVHSSLLILFLDYASQDYKPSSYALDVDIIGIYSLLLEKKHFIQDWEMVRNTFIQYFIHDGNVNRLFNIVKYNPEYTSVRDEFYKYCSAVTFFRGAKDDGSSIAKLPKTAVNAIASLTMRT